MAVITAHGRVTYLRAHKRGTKYGGANDVIDVEAIIRIEGHDGKSFGFTLRDDGYGPANRAMFDLLLGAYERGESVYIDYIDSGGQNHELIRVWLARA
jgi:hypothetical protein